MDREILSQEELDALLRGATAEPESEPEIEIEPEPLTELDDTSSLLSEASSLLAQTESTESVLTSSQIDALGEIGNITYGAASTTLSELLNRRIVIDTPNVYLSTQNEVKKQHPIPYLIVEVDYKTGLSGSNVLIVKVEDASVIASLMMGSDNLEPKSVLDQMELSAVGEAMNQMIGSASTSLATMFAKKIQIASPNTRVVDFGNQEPLIKGCDVNEQIVVIAFKLQMGDLINSNIMLIMPIPTAAEMADALINKTLNMTIKVPSEPVRHSEPTVVPAVFAKDSVSIVEQVPTAETTIPMEQPKPVTQQKDEYTILGNHTEGFKNEKRSKIPIQKAQFAELGSPKAQKETPANASFGLLLDVPLNVVVELGTATLKIKEILDLAPGSLIELNKIAGDMVDVIINRRLVAKGEVVVIDENFGIKITDIVSPLERVAAQNPNPATAVNK
jgi:flagellar motor switch protein FliN/FliY